MKFWRNGSTYSGRDGAGWLRWKMRKFYPNVKDPAEFISIVATKSEKTMVPYRVSCALYGDFHELSAVLTGELKALEEYEIEQAKLSAVPAESNEVPVAAPTPSPSSEPSAGEKDYIDEDDETGKELAV